MTDPRIDVDATPPRSPWFLPVAIAAIALLLVAIALAEDSVEPIDLADDPGPAISLQSNPAAADVPPATSVVRPPVQPSLQELVPGFDGTLHLWVHRDGVDRLLVWSNPLSEPRPMDLPEGTVRVDLSSDRLRTLVVTVNRNGHGVLWLGDRNRVEPALIFDTPIEARWDADRADRLAVSGAGDEGTFVDVYAVQPGNVLVRSHRLEAQPGRVIEWLGTAGIAMASASGQPVAEWLSFDDDSTTYSRHLTQPGGRPIFDICTGVPCRPTVRMYVGVDGTLVPIDPEVVQVNDEATWELVLTAEGPGVRRSGDESVIPIPISGLNAWSDRWLVFEAEAHFVETYDDDGELLSRTVRHPVGFLDLDGQTLHRAIVEDGGQIKGIWLP